MEPPDCAWGEDDEHGNWTGIVGWLQKQEADFSLNLTPSFTRLAVIDFTAIYSHDPFVIVSPKPKTLPRYLALLRPYSGSQFSVQFKRWKMKVFKVKVNDMSLEISYD